MVSRSFLLGGWLVSGVDDTESKCGVRGEGCHTSRPDDIVRRNRVDYFLGV